MKGNENSREDNMTRKGVLVVAAVRNRGTEFCQSNFRLFLPVSQTQATSETSPHSYHPPTIELNVYYVHELL